MWGNLANEVADHSAAIRGELAEGLDAWSAIVTSLSPRHNGRGSATQAIALVGRLSSTPGKGR